MTTPADAAAGGWRRLLRRERYDSGIPVDTEWDATLTAVNPLICLAFVVLCLVTVDPLGWTGWGLVGLVLIVVNAVLMATRTMPEAWFGDTGRLALAVVSAVTAGLGYGFDPSSWLVGFAYALAVHAGIRFETRVACAVAGLASVIAMGTVLLRTDRAHLPPWWLGATVFLAVAMGMLRRSRHRALASAHELVVQSRRAAASEAKAQVLADRAELARDLHDVLAHSLSGVNMQLSLANALFEAGRDPDGQEAVRRAQGMVVDGLAEARQAVAMLRTGTIDLGPTLQAMVSGEHETFHLAGEPARLGPAATQVVVRVAQESMTNARRHAPGAAVSLALGSTDGGLARLVVENGPPESPVEETPGSGLGLVGMRERAASVGGELEAGPVGSGAYAGGWRVVLVVPPGEESE